MKQENNRKPTFLHFFSTHPLVGLISFIASLISIILFIYALVEGKEKRDLTYCINPVKTRIVQSGKYKALEVLFDKEKIDSDVTAMQIAVWNKGRLPILNTEILETYELELKPPTRILDVEITKQSRNLIDIELSKESLGNGRIPINWKILEHNDGCVIQIIYSGNIDTDIEMHGSCIGQTTIHRMNKPKRNEPKDKPTINIGVGNIFLVLAIIFLPPIIILDVIVNIKRRARLKQKGEFITVTIIDRETIIFALILGILAFIGFLISPGNTPPFGF